ncbi:prepilin-type N-terminal cleavage/methylation domain-containing protein [Synechococcus sp. MIT S9508]|uniref:prepilin-type N-terminal cleavage/methylation domain-containing protein n=1 Tax=Synechococcus sp. MIT S9508 TaxID=1801629 RepID=UPI0007BB78D4|nr:prepilin-type N-terminal cleavage/methylation domain-containing protein [Synechococcus sp. MIT S9508]KZR89940.1 hypothetical protein MITS9508_01014 [Synechococcus sp. MIT S9508]
MLFTGVTSRQGKQASSGFTIWELMVVLVILAILIAAALPNLRPSMRREQLTAASLGIVNWLERARNQAVKDMETCQLSISADDASDASLAITSGSPGCRELTMFNINDQENTATDISLTLSDSSDSEFSFSPRGSVSRHQEMELTMEGSPTTRCIKVVFPVGLVRSGIKRDAACSYEKELKY